MAAEFLFDAERIHELLRRLDAALAEEGLRAELLLFGGAAMILGWQAREATRDVDALFSRADRVRALARKIGEEEGLPEGWLNDAVKGFIGSIAPERQLLLSLDHLEVYIPPPEYLLAMKAMAARVGPEHQDVEDLRFLIRTIGLASAQEVLDIVEHYYPRGRIPPRTQFLVEALFEELEAGGP